MTKQGKQLLEKAEEEFPQFCWRLAGDGGMTVGEPVVDGQATVERDQAMSAARARAAEHARRQREADLIGQGFAVWKARHPDAMTPPEYELVRLALADREERDHHDKSPG